MTSLRRRLGLPRLSIKTYILILLLLFVFAYIVTGPAHEFFAKVQSNLGSFYVPMERQAEEYLKAHEEKNR